MITAAEHTAVARAAWLCQVGKRDGGCAGIMAAVWNVAWPISTEYAEDSRYNTLLQARVTKFGSPIRAVCLHTKRLQ